MFIRSEGRVARDGLLLYLQEDARAVFEGGEVEKLLALNVKDLTLILLLTLRRGLLLDFQETLGLRELG